MALSVCVSVSVQRWWGGLQLMALKGVLGLGGCCCIIRRLHICVLVGGVVDEAWSLEGPVSSDCGLGPIL